MNFWGKLFDAWTEQGVVLDGESHIELHRVEKDGYYECRCKFPKEPDVMWSAFWLQAPSIGMTADPKWSGIENDIMENFYVGEGSTGNIYGGYGRQYKDEGRVDYKFKETEDGWHYFGMN